MSLRNLAYHVLRRGERYTGTDNVYLAKSGGWFAVAQFLATSSGLIVAIVAARFVDKGAYGTYSYMTSWGAIFSIAALSGMGGALSTAVARGHDRTISSTIRTRIKWGLLGTAAAVLVGCYYALQGRPDFFLSFVIVGICFPLSAALASWGDYVAGKKRFDLQARYNVVLWVGTALCFVAAILLRPTPFMLVLTMSVVPVLLQALILRHVLAILPPSGTHENGTGSYGKQLSVLEALSTVTLYVDRLLIFTFLGAHETAVYAFAMAPTEQIKGLLKSVQTIALPKVANRSLAEIREGFFRKTAVFAAGCAAAALAYILAAPFLFRLLFPKYMESVGYSQWLAVSLIGVIAVLPSSVFLAHKLLREQYQYQLISSLVSLVLMAVLIVWYGLPGAVMARVAGRLFGAVYALSLTQQAFMRASRAPQSSRIQDSSGPETL